MFLCMHIYIKLYALIIMQLLCIIIVIYHNRIIRQVIIWYRTKFIIACIKHTHNGINARHTVSRLICRYISP